MDTSINLPEHIRCSKAKYNAEKQRIEAALGSNLSRVDAWATLPENIRNDARTWANAIYFCQDTGEIFHRGVAYGSSSNAQGGAVTQEIENAVFPLEWVDAPGDQVFEKGQSVSVSFVWSIKRKGAIVEPTAATINSSTSGVASNKKSYSEAALRSNKQYTLIVQYNTQSISKIINYSFRSRTYVGVTSNSVVNSNDLNQAVTKGFEEVKFNGLNLNCSGGKNIFIAYPVTMNLQRYPEIWINGLKCTDVIISNLQHTNESGFVESYVIIKTANRYNASSVVIDIK